MKIAIVSQSFDQLAAENMSSVGICSLGLAAALSRSAQVCIYALAPNDGTAAEEKHGDVPVRYVAKRSLDDFWMDVFLRSSRLRKLFNAGLDFPFWASWLNAPSYRRDVIERLAEDRPDVILLQQSAAPVAALRKRFPGTPVILHLHAPLSPQVMTRQYRRLLGKCDAITGVSDFVSGHATASLGRRCHTIRNGFDYQLERPKLHPRAQDGIRSIAYLGAVSPEKGVHVLTEAFSLICETRKDVQLNVFGEIGARRYEDVMPQWTDEEDLAIRALFQSDYGEKLTAGLNEAAAQRTRFFGAVTRQEVSEHLPGTWAFAFPSLVDEGFGLPPVEAMGMGVPAVVSDSGPLGAIVLDGKTGRVVPKGDAKALAAALLSVIDNAEHCDRLGAAACDHVWSHFTWNHAAKSFLDVANGLLHGARGTDAQPHRNGAARSAAADVGDRL